MIVAIDNVGAQIYHEGSVLHFLHTESALSLGLNTPGAARKKQVIIIMMKKIGFERAARRRQVGTTKDQVSSFCVVQDKN